MIDKDGIISADINKKPMLSKHESGFTLIEVMVALAILAVVAVAASRASSAYLSSVDVLRTRTLAHFVAQNAAADLRIQETWLTANRTQTINAQGRDWQVVMTVNDAITPALKEVNIAVAPIIDGQTRTAVTDINVILSNAEQDIGSLDLSSLGADIAGQSGGNP
ncbi:MULTISPECIES: type II secretion system minor pseudopilin GspI [Psychrobacter]|jgi:general secretion pathway protein I|uniref:type II secretion system minor pseudopilin GspI n=1 Tax=Psychrobacter TaxID=497 RepID=UPI000EE2526F|nr:MULTISPECIES: type II secretion system minor pseudopilin GspI [Psychrobacter]MCG3808588.1 type II secretion system minor pseudopilin GspI [Psychrobacter sp. Ps4]HCI75314.1 type II secretion system protein GspI [Psychrobacter sp.]